MSRDGDKKSVSKNPIPEALTAAGFDFSPGNSLSLMRIYGVLE